MLEARHTEPCVLSRAVWMCPRYFDNFDVLDLMASERAWGGWKGLAPADPMVILLRCLWRPRSLQRLWSSPDSSAVGRGEPRALCHAREGQGLNQAFLGSTSVVMVRPAASSALCTQEVLRARLLRRAENMPTFVVRTRRLGWLSWVGWVGWVGLGFVTLMLWVETSLP